MRVNFYLLSIIIVFLYHADIIQHMTTPQVLDSDNIITVSKNGMVPAAEKFYFMYTEGFALHVNTLKYHNMGLLGVTPYGFNGYWRLSDIMRRPY